MLERTDGSRMPLTESLAVTGDIQDLLSVCCNETSTVTNLSFKYEKNVPRPIKAYVPLKGSKTERKVKATLPALSFEVIGGIGGVARWLETSEKYDLPVTLLTSNWYNDKAYNEDKLSRMFTAIEGLVSRKKNRKRASITVDELSKFVDDAIPQFKEITNREPKE